MEAVTEKVCSRCRVPKPLSAFGIERRRKDGLAYWCRACMIEKSRIYRERNPEKVKASFKDWHGRNREVVTAKKRTYYAENRERLLAKRKEQPELYARYRREYREKNPERCREDLRRHDLKRHYGLTTDEYDAMLEAQDGVCAICRGVSRSGRRLAVDHDHDTGAIRGLLCGPCNSALGLLRDSEDRLAAAIDYLRKAGGGDPPPL